MGNIYNDQMTTLLYFFPLESINDSFISYFKEGLEFKEKEKNTRKLIRYDVDNCINKFKIYRLQNRDKTNRIKYDVSLNDKSMSPLILNEICIIKIEEGVSYLYLKCALGLNNSDQINTIDECLDKHVEFVNSYHIPDAIKIVINGTAYSLFTKSGEMLNTIESEFGLKLDVNKYHIRFLMQTVLLDKFDKKYEVLERGCSVVSNLYTKNFNQKVLENNYMISKTSNFGTYIVYTLDGNKEDFLEMNKKNMVKFYEEYFYDFLIALNYRLLLEKQLYEISELKWDLNSSQEYNKLLMDYNEGCKLTSRFYFNNVSSLDYVNTLYQSILEGFDIEILKKELEDKYIYTMDYLKNKIEALRYRENKPINIFNSSISFVSSLALFIIAVFQCVLAFNGEFTFVYKLGIIIAGTLIILALIAKIVIFLITKKTRRLDID